MLFIFGNVSLTAFDRYLIFALAWGMFFAYRSVRLFRWRVGVLLVLLAPLCGHGVLAVFYDGIAMSHCIYTQQYQMARLARDYVRAPVAVNDIGLVGFQNPSAVVDLVGLGNSDLLREKMAGGFSSISYLAKRDAELIMVYGSWFPKMELDTLTLLGILVCDDCAQVRMIGFPVVTFYAKTQEGAQRLLPALGEWVTTLPAHTHFMFSAGVLEERPQGTRVIRLKDATDATSP